MSLIFFFSIFSISLYTLICPIIADKRGTGLRLVRSHLFFTDSHITKNWPYLVILLFITSTSYANDDVPFKSLKIHGFASQAVIFTSANHFFGNSEHGSTDFTELGINGSYQLLPKMRLATQLLSRHAGKMDNGSPHLDYALADINLLSSMKGQFGFYLGRIKNPIGLYNETRDVAFTRQGVFSAQTIYFDKVRDLILSSDGVQLYGNYALSSGTLFIRAGTGYSLVDRNVELAYLGHDYAGKLKSNHLAYLGQIMYEHNGGKWIFSATTLTADLDFKSRPPDQLSGINDGRIYIDYTVLSSQYNGEKWQFTTEIAFEKINYQGISPFYQTQDPNSLGYYLEANYKITDQIQSFVRHERFYLDKNDKYGKEFQARYPTLSPYSRYSRICYRPPVEYNPSLDDMCRISNTYWNSDSLTR